MDGTNNVPAPTTQNPYGLPPSLQAFMNSMQGIGKQLGNTMPDSAQYMRPAPYPTWSPGAPNNLLATILQMRQAQTQGLATPYQSGVAMPRVSLLNG